MRGMIKLICIDMDGVLVPSHNFWLELHKAFGTLEEGATLAKAYLTTDYQRLVQEVVGRLWQGRDATPYYTLVHKIPHLQGIQEFFTALNTFSDEHGNSIPRAIVSGGCYDVAVRIKNEYGISFLFANQLVIKNGLVSDQFHWPVGFGGYTKVQIIQQLCDDLEILPQNVLMIGDSEGDLEAFKIAGTSIAFNSQSKLLKENATHVVDSDNLLDMLPVLERIRKE